MTFPDMALPTNRKFGFFFAFVFVAAGVYFYAQGGGLSVAVFASLAGVFLVVTLVRADLLLPLNKAWMGLGLLLGMIISPIVLGLLFFGLITPVAVLTRAFGRDELRLKRRLRASYWRDRPAQATAFERQF